VLLVVITVVLSMAAMAGLLVISEETSEPAPEAVLATDVGPNGDLMLEHRGGDTVDTDQLGFVGPVSEGQSFNTETLSAGERISVDVTESGTGAVVWNADDGDLSTTLEEFEIKQSEVPAQGNWTELRTKLEHDTRTLRSSTITRQTRRDTTPCLGPAIGAIINTLEHSTETATKSAT
jgi:Protein of unknown function (DUF1628).